jgi:hypothetical protein
MLICTDLVGNGALDPAGLTEWFVWMLGAAVQAVPLLTPLVRGFGPQRRGIGGGGRVVLVGMPGESHVRSLERKSVARQRYRG